MLLLHGCTVCVILERAIAKYTFGLHIKRHNYFRRYMYVLATGIRVKIPYATIVTILNFNFPLERTKLAPTLANGSTAHTHTKPIVGNFISTSIYLVKSLHEYSCCGTNTLVCVCVCVRALCAIFPNTIECKYIVNRRNSD